MDFERSQSRTHNIKSKMSAANTTHPEQNTKQEVDLTSHELSLVRWEELALSLEEHFHAHDLWKKRPNGLPMGHR